MLDSDHFRTTLARSLERHAADRQMACAGDPNGEDLKFVELFQRLAREAEDLDAGVLVEAQRVFADREKARRLQQTLDDLPKTIGFTLWPVDAEHLVRWMIAQSSDDEPNTPASRRARTARAGARPGKLQREAGLLPSFGSEFSGAMSIVGPMIAIWEGATAIRQWRDHSFIGAHPATTATIVAVQTEPETRSFAPPVTATIAFVPSSGSAVCQVPVRLDGPATGNAPGQTLTVVPLGYACQVPFIPAEIGDPAASLLAAALFLAAGLASLKAWLWLWKQESRVGGKLKAAPLGMRPEGLRHPGRAGQTGP